MSLEERKSEEQRIRAHNDKIALRLFLNKPFKLGEGRNSEVYLGAYHRERVDDSDAYVDWHLCAVKRVQADQESQLAGLQEAFALRRLGPHPHIVRLISVLDEMELRDDTAKAPPVHVSDDPPRLLIVLEHLPCTLADYVRSHTSDVDLPLWLGWARQLAETVEWLHSRGCVHGDIKKENVLLTHNLSIKLCDFSAVLFSNAPVPVTDCYSVGTPAFRAPELFHIWSWSPDEAQGQAHPALSFTLDIFSLGVLLYSLATGVDPSHRVKSVMAIRQRQKHFFVSEEDDRMERLSFQHPRAPLPSRSKPWSQSQLRSNLDTQHPPGSPDLLTSLEKSLSLSGIQDTLLDQLLDPAPTPKGVFIPPTHTPSTLTVPSIKRATSYSPGSRKSDASSLGRCVSLSSEPRSSRPSRRYLSGSYLQVPNSEKRQTLGQDEEQSANTIHLASPTSAPPSPLSSSFMPTLPRSNHEPDMRSYADGAPALILPGGDRLPDALRELIRAMVSPQPEDRPLASQVLSVLNNFELPC